ncbi:MAG: sodium-dependent transporter [Marinicaulis sp.]|nr:sodium-dependent transporter [Marinicaulis sp.]NNE41739.1 sodium-dependent transporter [Marinicaulis sp.]NNL87965.1 sodium-dependent transporter [Marinicaulis sp.]
MTATTPTPQWSSRFAFLMAAVGAAVGLGNLWRFPFQTGANGGSAFVIIYFVCVVFIAYPILMAEIAMGRAKRKSAVGSVTALAADVGAPRLWGVLGLVGILASYFVLTTYSMIAGQILSFSIMSFGGVFIDFQPGGTLPLYSGGVWPIVWFSVFLGITIAVVAGGLKNGVERLVTIAMPIFFLLLLALSIYSMSTGAAGRTIDYLFSPRFSEVTPQVVLAAMGQAFYSIAVGTASMITYGAYLDRKENIASSSGLIAGTDTMVAIVAGLMIFPVVFAFNLDPAAGMGLIFDALPPVFSGLPGGSLIGGAFFLLAFLAALTSSIIMLLVAVVFVEEWLQWPRMRVVITLGALAWVIGVAATVIPHLAENLDFLAGSVFLPLAAFLGAVFCGWVVPREVMRKELANSSDGAFAIWRVMIRFVAPVAVAVVMVLGLTG